MLFGIALSLAALWIVVSVFRDYYTEMAQSRRRLKSRSKLINTSLGPVEYATEGQGRSIIVLHGAGGGYDQGLLISNAWINDDYHRIAVSRFGYLRSPLPTDPSHARQADIVAELMDSLRIEQAVIMGASAGGPSTLQFALRHPEKCRAIILVSAIGHEHPRFDWYQNLAFDLIFDIDFLYWGLITYLPLSFYTAFGIPPGVQATLTPAQRDSISYFLHSIVPISLRKSGTANDRIPRSLHFPIEQIKTPVLVIHAKDDNIVPYSNAEYVIQRIPQAQLIALSSGGHLLVGQYHLIKETITDFLKLNVYSET